MEYLFIYSLQMANFIKILAIALLFITPIFAFIVLSCSSFDLEDLKNAWNNWFKKTLIALFATTIFLFALPTKQTLLLMGGTYLGKRAVNAVATSDKLEKVNTIIDLQLDKYIKEMKAGNNDRK